MIRKIFQIGLGAVATAYVVGGGLAIAGLIDNGREAASIWRAYAAFGAMILVIGLVAGFLVWLARKWWWTLVIAAGVLCAAGPVLFVGGFWIGEERP